MTDPLKRDDTWAEIQPGCYMDTEGNAHVFPDEVLAYLQKEHPDAGFDPRSYADYCMVVETYTEIVQAMYPEAMVIVAKHERPTN